MFANMKKKIFDEVKASPQKIQQFAQAAQAAVSSASSTASESVSGSDNFFSITEEDTPQNSPYKDATNLKVPPTVETATIPANPGLPKHSSLNNGIPVSRTRKLSNSSVASDVSFRLPSYDSPAVYHLQSDLDISASEVEESSVSSTAHLDLISKEQLHSAYKKALDRYQKYRSRYTDLAKRYRDLERDSTKARAVLVETQDKAIRRISELREQCSLEQQAKAHLEESLRVEMDDMQCKIHAYQTKLKLLGEKPEELNNLESKKSQEESLINFDNDEIKTNNYETNESNEAAYEHLKRIEGLLSALSAKESEILILKEQANVCNQTIDELRKREEENSLLLAQNKLMIHSELENKEREMKTLKQSVSDVEKKLELTEKENAQFRKKHSDFSELQQKYKQLLAAKQEFEAKVISNEHILKQTQREIKEKESQFELLTKNYDEKIKSIQEFETKLLTLASENEELRKTVQENLQSSDLERKLNELLAENSSLQAKLDVVIKERENLQQKHAELENKLANLESQNCELCESVESKKSAEIDFNRKIHELENLIGEKDCLCEKYKLQVDQLNETLSNLIVAEQKLSEEKLSLQNEFEKLRKQADQYLQDKLATENLIEKERNESKAQVTDILQEIGRMEQELKEFKETHSKLESEKLSLEKKIEKIMKQNQENKDGGNRWQSMVSEAEDRIQKMDSKMKHLENENQKLLGETIHLTEKSNIFEKTLDEEKSNFISEKKVLTDTLKDKDDVLKELSRKLELSSENLRKLQEKMSQLLDENSRLHNAAEIIEHELRSAKSEAETKEKKIITLLESNKYFENELENLQQENEILKRERDNLNEMSNNIRGDLDTLNVEMEQEKQKHSQLSNEYESMKRRFSELEANLKTLNTEKHNRASEYETTISDYETKCSSLAAEIDRLSTGDKEQGDVIQSLKNEIISLEEAMKTEKSKNEELLNMLKSKETLDAELKIIQDNNTSLKQENESFKKEIDALNNQNHSRLTELETLLKRTNDEKQSLKESIKNATDLEKKLQNYEELKIENEYLNTLVNQLENDLRKHKEEKSKMEVELNELKEKFKSQQCEVYVLSEMKEKHATDMKKQEDELHSCKTELEQLKSVLEIERQDTKQQNEHNQFIMQQNDKIQKDLLECQQKLEEANRLCVETRESYQEVLNENVSLKETIKKDDQQKENAKEEITSLRDEVTAKQIIINDLTKDIKKTTTLLDNFDGVEKENKDLLQRIKTLETHLESLPTSNTKHTEETANLRMENSRLLVELEELRQIISQLSAKTGSQNELFSPAQDDMTSNTHIEEEFESLAREKDDLQERLNKIMNEVQDVSNRNLFLEQKCENYLILEQSNERLKRANEKLSRQLDETLVTIHHHEGISANTEFEYLRNIMFQYLTGNINGNATLVKVIAAVLKFSPQQTQVALEKEHQRHSLLGQLNKLL